MSKPNAARLPQSARKLNLNRETLRTLTPAYLAQVVGGSHQTGSDTWAESCGGHWE
jgi:hypothetical protein